MRVRSPQGSQNSIQSGETWPPARDSTPQRKKEQALPGTAMLQ